MRPEDALPATAFSIGRYASAAALRVLVAVTVFTAFQSAQLLGQQPQAKEQPQAPPQFRKAALIPVEGAIDPFLEQFLYRRLDAAREAGCDLVIVQIDSPGGLLDESLRIAERLLSTDWARTVAFVPKGSQALSGAAIAALGCDDIVMDVHARLGDAGPIFLAEDALFRHAPEKLVSDLAVKVRRLAKATGRPPALAEAMVDRNCQVFAVTNKNTGETTFMSEAELAALPDPDDWEKGRLVFESRADHFLEVEGERAVELKLASATAADVDELQRHYDWKQLITLEHTTTDTVITILNNPWITGLLLVLGLICLYVEFSMPSGIAGTVAGLCFVLFFWSRVLGGTAGWLEVVLFLFGAALVLVEIFLLPGFGFTGITGGVLIVVSVVMASQRVVIPRTSYDVMELTRTLTVMVAAGVGSLIAAFLLRRHFHMIPMFNSLVLAPPEPEPMPEAAVAVPVRTRESFLGQQGVTITPLRPAGRARFDGETIDVVAEGSYIPPGKNVRVVEIVGNRILVVEADAEQ